MVRGQQQIQVAVAVEISNGQSAPHFRLIESSSYFRGNITKFSLTQVLEELRRLRITNIPANVANCFVNVPISDRDIEEPVQVRIEEDATKPQSVSRRVAKPSLHRDIVIALGACSIESDHLIIKIRDDNP